MNTLEQLKSENSTAKRYIEAIQKHLQNDERGMAISLIDTANMAVRTANQLHDKLDNQNNGIFNGEELEAFCQAEENNTTLKKILK